MAHERLKVYAKAVDFVRGLAPQVDEWPPGCSVRDQIDRSMESVITNLVKAAWLQPAPEAIYRLECSLGSVLECAACLDIAGVRRMLDEAATVGGKNALLEIARMQVGLRKNWDTVVREESATYGGQAEQFPHESLRVYQRGLELYRLLFGDGPAAREHGGRHARRLDEAAVSLLLNIAEGNGRFAVLDHRKFIVSAQEAATRLAAYLDLDRTLAADQVAGAHGLLHEVCAMLGGLRGVLSLESKTCEGTANES